MGTEMEEVIKELGEVKEYMKNTKNFQELEKLKGRRDELQYFKKNGKRKRKSLYKVKTLNALNFGTTG